MANQPAIFSPVLSDADPLLSGPFSDSTDTVGATQSFNTQSSPERRGDGTRQESDSRVIRVDLRSPGGVSDAVKDSWSRTSGCVGSPASPWRWLVLLAFALETITTSAMFVSYVVISKDAAEYLNVEVSKITFLVTASNIASIFTNLTCGPVIEAVGLQLASTVAGGLVALAGAIRLIGASAPSYGILVTGQLLAGLALPFLLNTSTKVSFSWFPQRQWTTATTLACSSIGVGYGIGFLLPSLVTSAVHPFRRSFVALHMGQCGATFVAFLMTLVAHSRPPPNLQKPTKWQKFNPQLHGGFANAHSESNLSSSPLLSSAAGSEALNSGSTQEVMNGKASNNDPGNRGEDGRSPSGCCRGCLSRLRWLCSCAPILLLCTRPSTTLRRTRRILARLFFHDWKFVILLLTTASYCGAFSAMNNIMGVIAGSAAHFNSMQTGLVLFIPLFLSVIVSWPIATVVDRIGAGRTKQFFVAALCLCSAIGAFFMPWALLHAKHLVLTIVFNCVIVTAWVATHGIVVHFAAEHTSAYSDEALPTSIYSATFALMTAAMTSLFQFIVGSGHHASHHTHAPSAVGSFNAEAAMHVSALFDVTSSPAFGGTHTMDPSGSATVFYICAGLSLASAVAVATLPLRHYGTT